MKNANNIVFWLYTILVAITILNDKLSFLNLIFSFTYVIFCFYYAVKVITRSRAALCIFSFTVIYIIYAIISPNVHESLNSKWGMLNWECKVMLSFFPAYYFSINNTLSISTLSKAARLLLVVAIISYFLNIRMVLFNVDDNEGGITNNVGYLFVCILPLLFVDVKKNFIYIIITYIFIWASLKRGAILCGLITLPLFITLVRRQFRINNIVIILAIIVLSALAIHFIQKEINENNYLAKRVELTLAGDSSGRDRTVMDTWEEVENFDIEYIILGKGINYSMKIIGNYVHNDWLELLTSMGLLGCFFYYLTFSGMFKCCKRYCSENFRKIGYLIIVIAFIRTLISMNYFSLDSIPLYYTLGLICYKKDKYV